MVANTPGILPKTALVGSKIINYPFTIPKQLTDSADTVGKAGHQLIGGLTNAIGGAYATLEPRGPAKWLLPLFDKVGAAVSKSEAIAERNKTVFWTPFGEGMAQVGQAFGGPGAYWYAKKAGIETPTADTIKNALAGGLFKFPTAEELGGSAAASSEAPTVDPVAAQAALEAVVAAQPGAVPAGTEQTAEGAGQLAVAS